MLLIADSGSTKTDWTFYNKNKKVHKISTIGLNPYFVSSQDILSVLKKDLHPYFEKEQIKEVHFYGSGCNHKDKINEVESALADFFINATIFVEPDQLGTARAVCGDTPGIVAILGTGSNSCVYDGTKITHQLFSLGYILGDEGSGAVLGKNILKAVLSEKMPLHLREEFWNSFSGSPDSILDKIYSKPFPNRFLASFAPFAVQRMNDAWMKELLHNHLLDFFAHMITIYPNYQSHTLNLSGSLAWYLRYFIADLCKKYGMVSGKIIQHPIEELTAYHVQRFQA